jgi:hypothetical protein
MHGQWMLAVPRTLPGFRDHLLTYHHNLRKGGKPKTVQMVQISYQGAMRRKQHVFMGWKQYIVKKGDGE